MRPSLQARGTLRDLARQLGVSTATVSNAFNRPDQLSPALREKILAAARSSHYPGPNPAARMLSTGFARTIAVVYLAPLHHAFQDPAAAAFVGGVAETCAERRLGLLLLQGGEAFQEIVQTAAVDGLILYGMPKRNGTIRTARSRALPLMVVDQPFLSRVPYIGIDDRAAARRCAQHLKELGHSRVGIVSFALQDDGWRGPVTGSRLKKASFEVARRRLQGYLEVLPGLWEESLIWEGPHSSEEEGRLAAAELLRARRRPTALLAMSDRLAIGCMQFAQQHLRMRIPEDLAVVGFDDIPAAEVITPQLTTIRQPMQEKGRLAALSLLQENFPLRQQLPTQLIVRCSSVPA